MSSLCPSLSRSACSPDCPSAPTSAHLYIYVIMRLLLPLLPPSSCYCTRNPQNASLDASQSAHPIAKLSPRGRSTFAQRKHVITCGFGDELLDYITGTTQTLHQTSSCLGGAIHPASCRRLQSVDVAEGCACHMSSQCVIKDFSQIL